MGASSSALPEELTVEQVKSLVGDLFDEAKFAQLEKSAEGKIREPEHKGRRAVTNVA
jgi:hypothetical protein